MGGEEKSWAWQPNGLPPMNVETSEDQSWGQLDSSVNALSFGFVATAILISMFLVMALFERFLRPPPPPPPPFIPPSSGRHVGFSPKVGFPSSMIAVKEVSVLMPGEDIPTYIAQPVPLRSPPDRFQWLPLNHINNVQSSNGVRDPT